MAGIKTLRLALLIVTLAICTFTVFGQSDVTSKRRTVYIEITSFTDNSVSFSWSNYNTIDSTFIFRKEIGEFTWTRLDSTAGTTYTDNTVVTNKEYEYKFKVKRQSTPLNAYGYIAFGAKVNKKSNRGNILIVLDSRFTTSLANEIRTLHLDLIGDGWNPILIHCDTSKTHNYLKFKIDSVHSASSLGGILLVGHIPVPYSGDAYIDGHPDHRGAWPTDLFYVSDSTLWTDNTVNYTNSNRPANTNVIGDDKYDNTVLPESIFAPISRIDFANLPLLQKSELVLLKNYFAELSKYKHGLNVPDKKGVIENNFSALPEGFGYNGFMNFSSLLKNTNVIEADVLSTLSNNFYQWSYASGGGTDTSANGVCTISQLANTNYKGVFSMLFGSYFGDWNTNNNLLRAYLTEGKMLSTCWAGRPNWFFHTMGLNNHLGLSALKSINNGMTNATAYDSIGFGGNFTHITLLGDLSLRNQYSTQVQNFAAGYNFGKNEVSLQWSPYTAKNAESYDIYVANDTLGPYNLLASLSAGVNTYTYSPTPDTLYYFINAIYLDTTPNGSYFNNSIGTFISIKALGSSGSGLPLPVNLMQFTAQKDQGLGQLKWSSAQELNFSHYEIEKSLDAINWKKIGIQYGTNRSSTTDYTFYDTNLDFGINYYRLKMVDYDNTVEYSETAFIINEYSFITIYPNPSEDGTIYIKSTTKEFKNFASTLAVMDVFGNAVTFEIDYSLQAIKIKAAAGIYQLFIDGNYERVIILNPSN